MERKTNITRGPVPRTEKLVIYGPEGTGKSTLAARAPGALFLDIEDGTARLDVRRMPRPGSWEELLAAVKTVKKAEGLCSALVIDTADRAEQLCAAELCRRYRKSGMEEFAFGRGYTYLAEEFGRLLALLDGCTESGIRVIVLAHARLRRFELPDGACRRADPLRGPQPLPGRKVPPGPAGGDELRAGGGAALRRR